MTTSLHLSFVLSPNYFIAKLLSLSTRVAPDRDVDIGQGYKITPFRLFIDLDIGSAMGIVFMEYVCINNISIDSFLDKQKVDAHSW